LKELLADFMTQHLSCGVVVYLSDGTCHYANEMAAQLLGVPREQLLTENVLYPQPGEGAGMLSPGSHTLASGDAHDYGLSIVRPDGTRRDAEVKLSRLAFCDQDILVATLHDVTGQRAAEQMLQFMQFSVEHAEEMVFWMDPDGRFLYANVSACRQLGYSQDELLHMSVDQVLVGTSLEDCCEAWREVQRDGSGRFDLMARTKAGTTFPTDISASFLEHAGRSFVVGFARDITEQVRISEALRTSERFYRDLMDNVSDVVTLIDQKGGILFRSASVERILGYGPNDLWGVNLMDYGLIHPDDREAVQSSFAQIMQKPGRQSPIKEIRVMHADGSWRVLATVARSIVNPGGELLAVANSRDVTERQEAARALAAAEERYRRLADATSDHIFSCDLQLRLTGANTEAARSVNSTPEELLGRPLSELGIDTGILAFFQEMTQLVLATNAAVERVGEARMPGGETRTYHTTLEPVWAAGQEVVGFRGRARDVTEQMRAEAKMREYEEHLGQAGRLEAIGQLANGIAHDFNNLLTGIIGYSDLLLAGKNQEGFISGAAMEDVREIRETAERGKSLTKQILAFSRRQEVEPLPLCPQDAVVNMEGLLRRILGRGIQVRLKRTWDPADVVIDQGQLEQVILNLAVNARDAMTDGGTITIETANVTLDPAFCRIHAATPGRYVMLAVSDTGCGLEEELRAHIFEPYFTTKEPGMGTGLGLATVSGIVKQNRGLIDVESEVGTGSTFRVYLPVAPATYPANQGQDLEAPPRSSKPIVMTQR
jgi:two-component system, cell cycle sensor histidine kinase and response regulator CckA